jgi:hypothetical protein
LSNQFKNYQNGIFKKIGKVVKKGLKQVSFKNLVKVGASFDPTGIVGNLQGAHEAKKKLKLTKHNKKWQKLNT